MFIKKIIKSGKNNKKSYCYYRLYESYRINNNVRHRSILPLGDLSSLPQSKHKQLADRIEMLIKGALPLFSVDAEVEKSAQHFYQRIIKERLIDIDKGEKISAQKNEQPQVNDYETVDLNSIENSDERLLGVGWLCKQLMDELNIRNKLEAAGLSSWEAKLAMLSWLSRMVNPQSELETARWLNHNSALCELFDVSPDRINKDNLYKSARLLYHHKGVLEQFLSEKTNELFDVRDNILLYDLTNTYFEGRKPHSTRAQFGRSKEKRSDCKLISLALMTNQQGFIKYSQFYDGNISEPSTLIDLIEQLQKRVPVGKQKPLIVMDAGFATEDNLKMLKKKGYDYLCVTRKKLKDYQAQITDTITIKDKNDQPIEVKNITLPAHSKDTDQYLYIHSKQKQIKEESMLNKLSSRFVQGLESIQKALNTKGGIKLASKVHERIGRLKEKYPSIHKGYLIRCERK